MEAVFPEVYPSKAPLFIPILFIHGASQALFIDEIIGYDSYVDDCTISQLLGRYHGYGTVL
ncbi:hypothetical protein OnM2_032019 [Erysiphe neolycopersici]|uniref:Uncharacterized protein n=1 Tax=Erysiphe neolycopersici TaxID=212602 RepID=A0A420HYR5_9PEZI|nr:hypothetical protein OnM2_032019 [Erysiphe neolycopersici]